MLSVAWPAGPGGSSARAEHRDATRVAENVVRLEAELSNMQLGSRTNRT